MSDSIRIQQEDFDANTEVEALTKGRAEAGAVVSFVGLVRGDDGLTTMMLEHYPGMTEREIAAHAAEAHKRWPILNLRIVHRVGTLRPGERIVFVGASATHRKAAFEAVEFLMDYLKSRAPFWKEEVRGGKKRWVEARTEDETAVNRWR
jgi:molybdopterin synthase catalytic subunit